MALVTIYITGPRGQFATNVEGGSSHEAVRKGVEFFLDPFWKGPKPRAGTILRVCPMGGQEIRVRVSPGIEKTEKSRFASRRLGATIVRKGGQVLIPGSS